MPVNGRWRSQPHLSRTNARPRIAYNESKTVPAFDTVALTIATHLEGSLTKLHTHLRSHTVTQYGQGNADQIRKQLVNDTLL